MVTFVEELVDSGIKRSLALEAIKHVDVYNIQEGRFQNYSDFVALINTICHKCCPVKFCTIAHACQIIQYICDYNLKIHVFWVSLNDM